MSLDSLSGQQLSHSPLGAGMYIIGDVPAIEIQFYHSKSI